MTDSTSPATLTLAQISQGVLASTGVLNLATIAVTDVIVTAEIKAEYDAIPLNLALEKLQPAGDTLVPVKPIKLELAFNQTPSTVPINGKLSVTGPGAVTLFYDELMTLPFVPGPIPGSAFADGKKLELFMLGKTAGKLELTLETRTTAGATIFGITSERLELGVFELRLSLHEHDRAALAALKVNPEVAPISRYHRALKNLALPAQKALSDADKIQRGRVLHEQVGASHGRARLVIQKIDASHLPAGVEDYSAVIDTTHLSGTLELFDVEFDGTAITLPHQIPFSELTKADQVLFVQGKTKTRTPRDARVDVGINRPRRGLAHTPKRHVDWGTCSVVKIASVDLLHTPAVGKPDAWDPLSQRFTINFDRDPDGRKLELTADLGPGAPGVTVHFALTPHADNQKAANWGVDVPRRWHWERISWDLKHKDKNAFDDFMHLSATTDENGKAKVGVVLSRFGGDKFLPSAYIDQDPHLAKFIHLHEELSTREPVRAPFEVEVHRQFFYQLTKPAGHTAPQPTTAEAAYARVKATMTLADTVEYTAATAPPHTFYQEFQMAGGSSLTPKAVLGSHNRTQLARLVRPNPRQPVKAHALIGDFLYSPDSAVATGSRILRSGQGAGRVVKLAMNKPVFNPPLRGGPLVMWAVYQVGATGLPERIPDGNVSIVAPRADDKEVTVLLPPTTPRPTARAQVTVTVLCQAAKGPLLGKSFRRGRVLVEFDPNDVPSYNDSVAHEIAHAFGQVHGIDAPSKPAIPPPANVPRHPNSTNTGSGCHCGNRACIMFASGPEPSASHKFDRACHPYLLVENLSRID